jgi:hypothetical protein
MNERNKINLSGEFGEGRSSGSSEHSEHNRIGIWSERESLSVDGRGREAEEEPDDGDYNQEYFGERPQKAKNLLTKEVRWGEGEGYKPNSGRRLFSEREKEGERFLKLLSRKLDLPKVFPTDRIFFNLTEEEKKLLKYVFNKIGKQRDINPHRWKEESLLIMLNEFLEVLEEESEY